MHHVHLDTLTPFVELSCPSCGLDGDYNPWEVGSGMRCVCGYRYSDSDINRLGVLYAPLVDPEEGE